MEANKQQIIWLLENATQCYIAKETGIPRGNISYLKKGKIKNGYRFENGKGVPIMEDGKYIENPEIAEEYLPTQSGFFFGGTEYDQWYMQDIESTIEILTKVLKETDFDNQMVVYTSSW